MNEELMFSGFSSHLGDHVESQVWECTDEAPHVVESTRHFCYFEEPPLIKTTKVLIIIHAQLKSAILWLDFPVLPIL